MVSLREVLHKVWLHLPPISWRAALAALAVLAIDTFDSFGLDQQADEQAARSIGMLEGPFYGMGENWIESAACLLTFSPPDGVCDDRIGQKSVTVVLIDDSSLSREDWTIPVSYSEQARLASAIAAYDPAAIFLDFTYGKAHGVDPRAEVTEFVETLRNATSGDRTAVMIGPVVGQEHKDTIALLPLREIPTVGVAWRAQSWIEYPFRSDQARSQVEAAAGDAPPTTNGPHRARAFDEIGFASTVSPPMAVVPLYNAFCARRALLAATGVQTGYVCPENWLPPLEESLALTWGYGTSRASAAFDADGAQGCPMPENATIIQRFYQMGKQAIGAVMRAAIAESSGRDATESRCIYTDTLTATQVLNPTLENADQIESLLKDRVVLVGAGHSFTSDYHTIPHVGRVPGVYIHAMALDNLITDAKRFTRMPPDLIYDLDWADVVEIFLTIMIILIMWRAHLVAVTTDDLSRRKRMIWLGAGSSIALVLALLTFERLVLHWPPLNIFGVALLGFSVFGLLEQHAQKLAEDAQKA